MAHNFHPKNLQSLQELMSFSILQVVLDFHRAMGKWNASFRQ